MVVAHHVADDLRALAVLDVGGEVLLPHRVEDAALDGLQPVADVGQRARRDDRQRVVEIAGLRGFVQRDRFRLAMPPGGGPASISPAIRRRHRTTSRRPSSLVSPNEILRPKRIAPASCRFRVPGATYLVRDCVACKNYRSQEIRSCFGFQNDSWSPGLLISVTRVQRDSAVARVGPEATAPLACFI